MKLILLVLLCSSLIAAATNPTTYVLSVGANTFTVDDTSGASFTQIHTLPAINPTTRRYKVWIDERAAYAQRGGEAGCSAPCLILQNTARGKAAVNYEITDAAGSPLNPPVYSILQEFLQVTPPTHLTAPFTAPMAIHGFKDYPVPLDIAIPSGTDVSNLAVHMNDVINIIPGDFSVIGNSGTEHLVSTTPLVGFTSNGSACTGTTLFPHGLTTGDIIQQSFFVSRGVASQGIPAPIGAMNGLFTVASTPTANTYTIPCSLSSGDYNTGNGTVGQNAEKTMSKSMWYCGNEQWVHGVTEELTSNCLMIPVGATEFTAGATNTLTFEYKGASPGFIQQERLVHGVRMGDFNLIQLNRSCTLTSLVTSGANTTATCNSHGFADGDTVVIPLVAGPGWRFKGKRVIISHTTNAFVFATGTQSGWTTPDATYAPGPTSQTAIWAPTPVIKVYRCIIPASDFTTPAAPSTFTSTGDPVAGAILWASGSLKEPNPYFGSNNIASTGASQGHCSSCHARDGIDQKFFGYEPRTILIAGMHRGLTETQANDVAAYILSLNYSTSTKGRPWNAPYQPGVGLDAGTTDNWAWGAGKDAILGFDMSMPEWLYPLGSYATWAYNNEVNNRQVPLPISMPRWNGWLPQVAPEDTCVSYGCTWASTSLSTIYEGYIAALKLPQQLASGVNTSATAWTTSVAQACTNNDFFVVGEGSSREFIQVTAGCGTTSLTVVRGQTLQGIATSGVAHSAGAWLSDYTAVAGQGGLTALYETGFKAGFQATYDTIFPYAGGMQNTAMFSRMGVATMAWTVTKYWELFNVYRLQDMNDLLARRANSLTSLNSNAGAQYKRGWFTGVIFNRGPHKMNFNGQNFFLNTNGGNTLVHWNYQTMVWYALAQVLTLDDRLNQAAGSIDWPYTDSFIRAVSEYFPFFNMKTLWHPVQLQQTLGFPDLYTAGPNWTMSIQSLEYGKTYDLLYAGTFTDQTITGNFVKQSALLSAAFVPLFTTMQWQTALNAPAGYNWPITGAVDVPRVFRSEVPNLQSEIAFGLPIMVYYGADSGAVATIVAWANAVWQSATGHDFQTDADAGPMCSLVPASTSNPAYVDCPTFH